MKFLPDKSLWKIPSNFLCHKNIQEHISLFVKISGRLNEGEGDEYGRRSTPTKISLTLSRCIQIRDIKIRLLHLHLPILPYPIFTIQFII